MTRLQSALLIAIITISFNGISQRSIDSTLISKSIRLINDYKKCKEINDSLLTRNEILWAYKLKADRTLSQADSVINNCSTTIEGLNEKNVHLTEQNERVKKNRKWFFFGGLIAGVSVIMFL